MEIQSGNKIKFFEFLMMYKKIYWGFFILSFLFAKVIMPKNNDYGSIVLIGMVIPTVLSYINIELIELISVKK